MSALQEIADTARLDQVDRFLRDAFGITVGAYTPSLLTRLLEDLPIGVPLDHPDATDVILKTLAIHETYFFRHPDQLKQIPALARQLADPARPLRVWSACCATGEEAYTLAVLLREASLAGGYTVFGTDLDPAAIETANEGRYRRWALRGLAPEDAAEWMDWQGDSGSIRDNLRAVVSFEAHNLMSPSWPDGFDLIVCRNALIYFDEDSIRTVYRRFLKALRPGGVLMVASSDPVPEQMSGWIRETNGKNFYFRRPDAKSAALRARERRPVALAPRPKPAPARVRARKPAPRVARSAPAPTPTPTRRERSPAAAVTVVAPPVSDEAALVGSIGQALAAGDTRTAQGHARRLLLKDSDGIVANLLASHVFGATQYARVRMKKACDRLARLPNGAPVRLAGGMSAGQLLTLLGDDNGLSAFIDRLRR